MVRPAGFDGVVLGGGRRWRRVRFVRASGADKLRDVSNPAGAAANAGIHRAAVFASVGIGETGGLSFVASVRRRRAGGRGDILAILPIMGRGDDDDESITTNELKPTDNNSNNQMYRKNVMIVER